MNSVFKILVLFISVLTLAACGGGSDSGGSTSPTGGGGSGGGTGGGANQPVNGGVPTLFEASFEENGGFAEFKFPVFTVNAPGNDVPQNLALNGADATPFTMTFAVSAADANGDRTVETTLLTSDMFNYEAPRDENQDNLYEFELTGTFNNMNVRSDVRVSIIDLDDDAETTITLIKGETALQTFGIPFLEVPDITGDGIPEFAVANQSGKGPAASYVVDSEFFVTTLSTRNVGPGIASGVRFLTDTNADVYKPNGLSALAQADGSGVDIILSVDTDIYVYPINSVADYAAIQGDTNPSTVTGRINYSLISPDGVVSAQLIPDVNGDNINDIAVLLIGGNDGIGEAGIIFGVDDSGLPKTIASGFDVTFHSSDNFGLSDRDFAPRMIPVPDLDGDGIGDLVISTNSSGGGEYFFLKSAVLGTASATPIDLDNLDLDTQGYKDRLRSMGSISVGQDYDNDGSPTLLIFGASRNNVILVDGHEFAAHDPNNSNQGFGENSRVLTREGGQFGSFGVMVDDMNGDGNRELLAVSRFRGAVSVIDGQLLVDTVNNTSSTTTFLQADEFDIDLRNFFGSDQDVTDTPIFLQGADLIAVPWASNRNPTVETDPGSIAIFSAGVVREAFASGATGVTIVP